MKGIFVIVLIIFSVFFHCSAQVNWDGLVGKSFSISKIPKPSVLDEKIQDAETKYQYKIFFSNRGIIAKIKIISVNQNNVKFQYLISDALYETYKVESGEIDCGKDQSCLNNFECCDCFFYIEIPKSILSDFNSVFSTILRSLPASTSPEPNFSKLYHIEYSTAYPYTFKYISGNIDNQRTYTSNPCAYFSAKCYDNVSVRLLELRNSGVTYMIPFISKYQWKSGSLLMVEYSDLKKYLDWK